MTIEMVNGAPDMRQVLVLGDYYPYDFPVLGRYVTFRFVHLWRNKTLYDQLYYSGTSWTPIIKSGYMDVRTQSPGNITGSTPYQLKFYAQNCQFTCTPVRLAGGELITMEVIATVAQATSGFDWYIALQNGTASYTWPT